MVDLTSETRSQSHGIFFPFSLPTGPLFLPEDAYSPLERSTWRGAEASANSSPGTDTFCQQPCEHTVLEVNPPVRPSGACSPETPCARTRQHSRSRAPGPQKPRGDTCFFASVLWHLLDSLSYYSIPRAHNGQVVKPP